MKQVTPEQEFKQTEIGEIPADWDIKRLEDTIINDLIESKNSVPQNLHKTHGKYPIVDQGKEPIAGYTDDEWKIYKESLPLIIFGDHTRVFKYVDFPFATGADGTKLLKPSPDCFHPKYLFYAFNNLFIPSRGYNRHFKLLKDYYIAQPPKPEQEKIAFVLSEIQKAVEIQGKIVANLKELKAVTMAKLFREGTRGEPLKQTEIGEIPQSWEIIPFRDTCHNFFSGGTPSTKKTEYWNGTIAWTTSAHITGMFLQTGQRNITKAGLENSASNFVTSGNILVGTRVGVGKVAINLIDVAISQDITGCIVKKEGFISEYLAFALLTNRCQQFFSANKRGATIKGIPREDVINLFLPIPKTKQEQQEIVDTLLILDRKSGLATNKLKYLQSLFTSTLHQLMTGKKRVKDLNIEALDNAH